MKFKICSHVRDLLTFSIKLAKYMNFHDFQYKIEKLKNYHKIIFLKYLRNERNKEANQKYIQVISLMSCLILNVLHIRWFSRSEIYSLYPSSKLNFLHNFIENMLTYNFLILKKNSLEIILKDARY